MNESEKEKARPAARGVRQRYLLECLLHGAPVNLQDFHAGNQWAAAQFRSYETMFKRLEKYGFEVVKVPAGPRGGVRYLLKSI